MLRQNVIWLSSVKFKSDFLADVPFFQHYQVRSVNLPLLVLLILIALSMGCGLSFRRISLVYGTQDLPFTAVTSCSHCNYKSFSWIYYVEGWLVQAFWASSQLQASITIYVKSYMIVILLYPSIIYLSHTYIYLSSIV